MNTRSYQVLLVEQVALPVEETLRSSRRFGVNLDCRREPWSEKLAITRLSEPVDLVIPLVSGDPEKARRLFEWLEKRPVPVPTLAIVPGEAPADVLAVASETVDDFVLWPLRRSELDHRISRMLPPLQDDLESARNRLNRELGLTSLIGAEPAFVRTINAIPRVAASDATVLVSGETGTGKELCARAIHHLSRRRNFPFVPLDCAAFPEQLLENELFGHSRGAFTDARTDQKGLATLAEGGTLFLDEIDSLSLPGQAKLLRFLEDRVYRPLGSERFARANIRVVAASNRDLEECVRQRTFRADLFFRLNVFQLRMPPLRERRADVALLAQHFMERVCADSGRARKTLSASALRRLTLCDWPGNVRQLFNEIQRTVAFVDRPQILPSDLNLPGPDSGAPDAPIRYREARARVLEDFERRYVEDALVRHENNITRAAREAGKDRRAFGRLVKKLGIRRFVR